MLIALVWGALFFIAGMRLIWVVGLAAIGGGRAGRRLFHGSARGTAHPALPRSGFRRHLQIDIALESFVARRLVRPRARARARSSACCRTATPTSCSRSRPRNSASCSACCCWRCSPSSCCGRCGRRCADEDPFMRFAAAGLAILFGLQSAINMAVNLHLMPAKGMTLPFISYGGSSMISLAYGMGMLLALTPRAPARRNAGDAATPADGAGVRPDGADGAPLVLVAAGGTGGHLFPAEALAAWRWRARGVVGRARDRRARDPLRPRISRPRHPRHPERDRARAQSAVAGARPAAMLGYGVAQGLRAARPAAARGGGRLRRLSDRSAAAGGDAARHPDRDPRAERASWAAPTDAGAARDRDRDRLSRRLRRRSGARRQGDPHRQSGAPGGGRGGATPYPAVTPASRCASWCSAAARARG